ncbi:DUF2207 family protein [Persephonella sp.]
MTEQKRLKTLLFITGLIGITGLYISSSLDLRNIFKTLTAEYSAKITLDRQLRLYESYIFHVKQSGIYRMLYRYWEVPLLYEGSLNRPYIRVKSVETLYRWYVKDNAGRVYGDILPEEERFIRKKAYTNETGMINLSYFTSGRYLLEIFYNLYPPINSDEDLMHINLKLADRHIPYTDVKIEIIDPEKKIVKIFPHLTDFSIHRTDTGYLITGKSPEDKLIEVEMIVQKYPLEGFINHVEGVYQRALQANQTPAEKAIRILQSGLSIAVVLFPVFFYLFYLRYGKEKDFVVPQFISFIPDKSLKPYIVNLIFNSDAVYGDENGFYATLLDLHMRNKIKIKDYGTDLQIEIIDEETDDPYEKKVFYFLKSFTVDKEKRFFSSAMLESRADSLYTARELDGLQMLKNQMDSVFRYKNPDITNRFLETSGKRIFYIFSIPVLIAVAIFSGVYLFTGINSHFLYIDLYPLFILSITLGIQVLMVFRTPSQFLGKWKNDYYRLKLQWDGFKKFLSDLAMIKKYAPEDIVIWKEWLVYGTALGVAKKVEKALKALNIKVPEVEVSRRTRFRLHRIYIMTGRNLAALQASRAAKGGGGFGAGGGFGGGGAGGR